MTTAALDTFMSQLISTSQGCSCNMEITSDNAKTKTEKRPMPGRCHSLPPLNRWDVDSHFHGERSPGPLSPVSAYSAAKGRLSRWESLTGDEQSNLRRQSLPLPIRKVSKWDEAPRCVSRSKPDMMVASKHLPASLRSLPY
jgi:hypothetical protein